MESDWASATPEVLAALKIARTQPPKHILRTKACLGAILGEGSASLGGRTYAEIDRVLDDPLTTQQCPQTGKEFCCSKYNRDLDAWRSPWSSQYVPPMEVGAYQPSPILRQRELFFNNAFHDYLEQYYGGGISSVHCWDVGENWAACFAIKKTIGGGENDDVSGFWDVTHVVEVLDGGKVRVISGFLFNLEVIGEEDPEAATAGVPPPLCFSGQCSRTKESTVNVHGAKNADAVYLECIGPMLEETENFFRSKLDTVYLAKAPEIANAMSKKRQNTSPKRSHPGGPGGGRRPPPGGVPMMGGALMGDLSAALKKRNQ